jgi:hypothetical protein
MVEVVKGGLPMNKNLVLPLLLSAALTCSCIAANPASAQGRLTDGEKSMAGIRRAYLSVSISDEVKAYTGESDESVASYLRARLKSSGLIFVSERTAKSLPGKPILTIYAEKLKSTYFDVTEIMSTISLGQEITLVRSKSAVLFRSTWQRAATGFYTGQYPAQSARGHFRENLDSLARDFNIAYKKANPR